MKEHKLKTWKEYFADIWYNAKRFELRKNDRNYQVGDELLLQEYDRVDKIYSGREVWVKVTYILEGGVFGLKKGYCVLGFSVMKWNNCLES